MWHKWRNSLGITLLALVSLKDVSCTRPADIPTPTEVNATPVVPSHFPAMPFPPENPFSAKGIALGRELFFDPILSIDTSVSCGTCHLQNLAFSDGMALSTLGVTGRPLGRHTQPLQNLAWMNKGWFWDGGVTSLELLSLAPLEEPDEMGHNINSAVRRLNRHPHYPAKFKAAFGKDSVNNIDLLKSLAQYMRTLTSTDSRYDRWRQGKATLTSLELDGLALVRTNCTPCHAEPFFTDHDFHNTGLQAVYNDPFHENIRTGRYRITGSDADRGKFKTPSLRNIMVTAPYMHDGRISNLDAVLDHYHGGVVMSPQLDPLLQNPGKPLGIQITASERTAIKAFLNTLTDSTFLGLR